jgi:hypothetical protein
MSVVRADYRTRFARDCEALYERIIPDHGLGTSEGTVNSASSKYGLQTQHLEEFAALLQLERECRKVDEATGLGNSINDEHDLDIERTIAWYDRNSSGWSERFKVWYGKDDTIMKEKLLQVRQATCDFALIEIMKEYLKDAILLFDAMGGAGFKMRHGIAIRKTALEELRRRNTSLRNAGQLIGPSIAGKLIP